MTSFCALRSFTKQGYMWFLLWLGDAGVHLPAFTINPSILVIMINLSSALAYLVGCDAVPHDQFPIL